jgi:hypothetical protein
MHDKKCLTEPYLQGYSICRTRESAGCPYAVLFADSVLCRHPDHQKMKNPPETPADF